MIEFIKRYYLYIAIIIVIIIGLVISIDFDESPIIAEQPLLNEQEEQKTYIYVDVRGEILNPGVYKIEKGTRLFQLIYLAGGFTKEVDLQKVNQSILLEDEMYIYIPNIQDIDIEGPSENNENEDIVNINKATQTELETLPGIGPTTALKIIDYRLNNGDFKSIEEIMNVPGIGETTFNEIKFFITV